MTRTYSFDINETIYRPRGWVFPVDFVAKTELDKWKERAELAEKRLAVLMKAVEELWKEVEKS